MGALQNIEKGDFEAALNDIETSLGKLFNSDVLPALKTFINQFASELGAQLLSDAATVAPTLTVLGGTVSITDAATQLLAKAGAQATSDATNLALNALRVQVTALAPVQAAS